MFNENQMDTLEWMVMKILNAKYEDIHGKVIVAFVVERDGLCDGRSICRFNGDGFGFGTIGDG